MKTVSRGYGTPIRRIFKRCDGKRLVLIDTGYIGLVPEFAQLGDRVLVLKGARTPFLFMQLKMQAYEDSTYNLLQLVGPTCIQGIMFGHVWKYVADNHSGVQVDGSCNSLRLGNVAGRLLYSRIQVMMI